MSLADIVLGGAWGAPRNFAGAWGGTKLGSGGGGESGTAKRGQPEGEAIDAQDWVGVTRRWGAVEGGGGSSFQAWGKDVKGLEKREKGVLEKVVRGRGGRGEAQVVVVEEESAGEEEEASLAKAAGRLCVCVCARAHVCVCACVCVTRVRACWQT
jgi:hypothetical protein